MNREGNTRKPNFYTTAFIIVSIIVIVAACLVAFFPISVDSSGASNSTKITVQTVPTLINGITTSTGIAVALGTAMIAVLFREEYRADFRAKTAATYVFGLLIVAIFYPWGSYIFLTIGLYEFAIKYALSGYLFAIFAILFAYLYGARRLGFAETKTESDKGDPDKSKPDENKSADQNKNVNVFVNENNQ